MVAVVAREDLSVRIFWNGGDDFVSAYQNAVYPWRMFGLGHRMRGYFLLGATKVVPRMFPTGIRMVHACTKAQWYIPHNAVRLML